MLREPAIAARVLAVARERAGGDIHKLEGDLIAAELSEGKSGVEPYPERGNPVEAPSS